jgi:hypothetical protein
VRAQLEIVTPGVPSESLRRSLEVFNNDTGATTVCMGGAAHKELNEIRPATDYGIWRVIFGPNPSSFGDRWKILWPVFSCINPVGDEQATLPGGGLIARGLRTDRPE